MKINIYKFIDAVFILGIFIPMGFDWCAYSERGFTGSVMFFNPIFIACVFAMLFYRKNIKVIFVEYFLMLISYFYSPMMLLHSLTFLERNWISYLSLIQPAFIISFSFAVLWGMWIIISVFINEKSYSIGAD